MEAAGIGGGAVEVRDNHAAAGQLDDLVLPQLHGVAGVFDEGGDIGGEEVLAVADAHHQRGVAACRDDPVRVGDVDRHQRERALQAGHDRAHGGDQVGPGRDLTGQQMGCHL